MRVKSMGMVTSLGHDVVASCAAARAGLSRAVELEGVATPPGPEGEPDPVRGHAVRTSAFGFQGVGRLEALLRPALEDLRPRLGAPQRPGLYLAFGDRGRHGDGEAERDNLALGARLAAVVCEVLGLELPEERRTLLPTGRCGFSRLVERARADLEADRIATALVVVVDSLVDERALDWLSRSERLKSGFRPAGLLPGEAAVAFVLDAGAGAVRLGRPCFQEGGGGPGEALARVLAATEGADNAAGWVVTDQNGEEPRAREWGHALVRTVGRLPVLRESEAWYPVVEFGDTGAASGAVHCATMVRALERGYAPRTSGVLVSLDDDGTAGALTVHGDSHGA